MDPTKIYENLTHYNLQRIRTLIEKDEIRATSRNSDQIYLKYLMIFKYFIRTFKLVVIIMSVSYFLGVIWYIISFEMFHH